MSKQQFKVHPAAEAFPMMDAEQYAGLLNDIRENGQNDSIVFWCELLVDGRNRLKACNELGVEPETCELPEDADPVAYVISANLHRRHLTTSQRSKVAEKFAQLKRGDNQHTKEDASIDAPSESEAAKLLNVSRANVQRAKAATKHCSKEVNAAIEDGTLTLNMATNLAKSIPDKREQTKVLKQGKEAVKQAITQAKSSEPAHKPALPKQINNDDSDECYDYQVVQSFPHWDYRLNTLRRIIGMLSKSEQLVVAEWLAN